MATTSSSFPSKYLRSTPPLKGKFKPKPVPRSLSSVKVVYSSDDKSRVDVEAEAALSLMNMKLDCREGCLKKADPRTFKDQTGDGCSKYQGPSQVLSMEDEQVRAANNLMLPSSGNVPSTGMSNSMDSKPYPSSLKSWGRTSRRTNLGCNYEEKGSLLSSATDNTSTSLKRKMPCLTRVPSSLPLPFGERVHEPTILEKKEEEEISQIGISLELSLRHEPPWKVKKTLVSSDRGSNSRLLLPKRDANTNIIPHMDRRDIEAIRSEDGMDVIVVDMDENTEHNLVLKYLPSLDGYTLKKAWKKEFVNRRQLQVGDEVGLFWDPDSHRFYFSVVRRAVDRNPQA